MYTSVRWLNDYLDPPATAEEQAELLTRAGFPLEETETAGDDVRQDYEMTSNRGDCVCHVGLAREIAAISDRRLKLPAVTAPPTGPAASGAIAVINEQPELCPLYTARVIRGVKVGPSPQWLQDRLIARGDIPRNNVVDATNFVLFELGQPTHVFDLAKLKGGEIRVRMARGGETFLPIGEGSENVTLTTDDLVIADAQDAVAMAGVKGGQLSAVGSQTTDIVLEAAAFDPVTVRRSSRRHGVSSDSCYRFERGVHPGQVDAAAERLAGLIMELAGGELAEGVVRDGRDLPPPREVTMRTDRCRALLGIDVDDTQMSSWLGRLEFKPSIAGGTITCAVPPHRLDIEREVDLIEEVGRMHGLDRIPVADAIRVRIGPADSADAARRATQDALAGMGFVQTVTHSLCSERDAVPFLLRGTSAERVDDDRADPYLRPSLLPSLLRVRQHNLNNGVRELRLFESGAVWWRDGDACSETRRLGLLVDAPEPETALRELRGVIDRLGGLLLGRNGVVEVRPDATLPWLDPGAEVFLAGGTIGSLGVVSSSITDAFDLEHPVVAAELALDEHFAGYPPEDPAVELPAVPAIERDVSAIVDDGLTWAEIHTAIDGLDLEHLETIEFVTVYRGRQIGAGRKSVTLRCRFRAPDRTLVHDEVDPQMTRLLEELRSRFSAEIRT